MSIVSCHVSMSLDGFVAGPDQSAKNPVGVGGMRLYQWVFASKAWHEHQGRQGGEQTVDCQVIEEVLDGVGAYIMGRHMFGGGEGPWDESWHGWWGEEPAFRAPVFVLTHYPREPLEMRGGTTFTFVTEGIEAALEQARRAAGGQAVSIAGGAETVRQFLAAGMLDELYVHLVPIVLGAGERLLLDVGDPTLELVKVVPSPKVTHIKYRIVH
ncbi:dihydrofolate reductase family protein [Streptomyces sp. NBC_01233]|uniref:dihydrofolate reductase family protein n=1 Tax=Streptomyces sp. NBC_01233 TaxID=2903787 RepID=UPI002E12A8FB|nr:dihydrofolate reductase family protein [Streptomyces sp. NBC_01233]